METQEIFKDITGYEGFYQVSNLGRIKSFKNNRWGVGKEKILKGKIHHGYIYVSLNFKNKKEKSVHRLVALTFIPNPDNKPQVNHINGIRNDNRVENLEWVTNQENTIHSYKVLGRKSFFEINNPKYWKGKFGKEHNCSKKVNQYDLQGNFIKTWDSMNDIEKELGIKYNNISKCCNLKRNKSGGFKWKFYEYILEKRTRNYFRETSAHFNQIDYL